MDLPRLATGPRARVGVWLPVASLAAFRVVDLLGAVAFPNAVLAVTFLAALAWVAVGVGGEHVADPLGVARYDSGRSGDAGNVGPSDEAISLGTAAVIYLSVTTALGWAVVLLLY